jgi:hypothetical protein
MFYTYMYLREDGTPYYVGKGTGYRAYAKHKIGLQHTLCSAPPKSSIVVYPADSEADALKTETALIWYYGRKDAGTGCLRNLTDGGENPPNWKGKKRSEHHSKAMRGNKNGLGRRFTPEQRANYSRIRTGLTYKMKQKIRCKRGHARTQDNLDSRNRCKICRQILGT